MNRANEKVLEEQVDYLRALNGEHVRRRREELSNFAIKVFFFVKNVKVLHGIVERDDNINETWMKKRISVNLLHSLAWCHDL